MPKLTKGLVQVYTGNGKGKTSAAFGLALRASGRGLKVFIIQFIKGGFDYGELYVIDKVPNITLRAFGRGKFVTSKPPEREDLRLAKEALDLAKEVVKKGEYDIVILDEINVALSLCLISLSAVVRIVKGKPTHVEIILTGRDAPEELIRMADLVTEMKEVKHPFNVGLASREGIEY